MKNLFKAIGKIIKSVARAIGKVVKAVGRALKKIGQFIKKYARVIVAVIVAVAIVYFTAGAGAGYGVALAGGGTSASAGFGLTVAAGAAAGAASGLIMTGSLKGMLEGAFFGAITAGFAHGVKIGVEAGEGVFSGLKSAAGSGINFAHRITQLVGHGVIGGLRSLRAGGKFLAGFVTGAVSKLVTFGTNRIAGLTEKPFLQGLVVATAGGVTSVLAGGSFELGFLTAGLAFAANNLLTRSQMTQITGKRDGKGFDERVREPRSRTTYGDWEETTSAGAVVGGKKSFWGFLATLLGPTHETRTILHEVIQETDYYEYNAQFSVDAQGNNIGVVPWSRVYTGDVTTEVRVLNSFVEIDHRGTIGGVIPIDINN